MSKFLFTLIAATASLSSVGAQAQKGKGMSMSSEGGGSRDYALSIPLALYGESVVRLELNLQNLASVTLEGTFKRKGDDIDEKDAQETRESLVTDAKGGILLVSRYTDPTRLAGFYWSLGAGYREVNADWVVQPDAGDKQADLTLAQPLEDETQVFHHRGQLVGTTMHLRGGYRYVADELPLMIGAFVGVRHYQSNVNDVQGDASESAEQTYTYSNMTDHEKERLKRRYMTQLEPAIEIGFIF